MRRDDIEIPEPCHADWDQMRPEDRGRFCFECRKKVHDLSAMTETEARSFLRRTACEDVCISYEYDGEGQMLFQAPTPAAAPVVPLARLRRHPKKAAAMVGAGMAVALAACAPHGDPSAPLRHEPEVPAFASPTVVIPHGEQPEAVNIERTVEEDEPCGTEVSEPPPVEPAIEKHRIRGRRPVRTKGTKPRRTAGVPVGFSG